MWLPFFVNQRKKKMETDVKIPPKEFSKRLQEFHGTQEYHSHKLNNDLGLLLTDGCHFIREKAAGGAYWLFDLILSYQLKLRKHRFQVWKLEKQPDKTWFVECSDGNGNFLIGQEVPYSDFPIDIVSIWVVDGVALLPNEY